MCVLKIKKKKKNTGVLKNIVEKVERDSEQNTFKNLAIQGH